MLQSERQNQGLCSEHISVVKYMICCICSHDNLYHHQYAIIPGIYFQALTAYCLLPGTPLFLSTRSCIYLHPGQQAIVQYYSINSFLLQLTCQFWSLIPVNWNASSSIEIVETIEINRPPPGPIVQTSSIDWKCPKSIVRTIPIFQAVSVTNGPDNSN